MLSRPDLRDGNWAWTAIEADCGGFPDCRNSCGAACGLPPIGAILTSDGANPGLQGAGSVSGSRSPYTFMYCPYYPTATSLPPSLDFQALECDSLSMGKLADKTHIVDGWQTHCDSISMLMHNSVTNVN